MTFGAWFRWLFPREREENEHIGDEEVLRRVRVLDATALRSAIDESLRPLDMLNRPFHPFMRLAPDEDDIVEPAINEKIAKASDAFLDEMAKPVLKYSAEGMKVIEERNARVVHFVKGVGRCADANRNRP